jgi:hypothetical protein
LSGGNTLHERKLYSRSQTSEQYFVSAYHVYSVNIDGILLWMCEV